MKMNTWLVRSIALLGAAVGLASCRAQKPGGEGEVTVLITQYGDSTIAGYHRASDGTYPIYKETPWEMLQSDLREEFGDGVSVHMYAVGGATLRDLLQGKGSFPKPLAEGVKDDSSQIATVRFGLNDAGQYDVATYKAYLVQAVTILRDAGKVVVLEEPTPTVHVGGRAYANAVDEVAQQFGLPLVRSFDQMLSIPAWKSMMSDDMHPTLPLYRAITAKQAAALVPVIERIANRKEHSASKGVVE